MADQYDLENRVHESQNYTFTGLQTFWIELTGYGTGISDTISGKVERELAHKYLQATNSGYYPGALN